jgi:CheY-like chemotaxis protein
MFASGKIFCSGVILMPTKKIVLSDDPVLLEILKSSYFQQENFAMVVVKDGQTGFQAVEAEAPLLAIFDIALLGEQAIECCRLIKQDALLADTPVLLVLPENAAAKLADDCWAAGTDAVVHRPLESSRFLNAAFGLLGISRRLAKRFPVSFKLKFLDSKQKQHTGICRNINVEGMYLATGVLFPVDTQLSVEFTLPGFQSPISVIVRVAWVNHPEWLKKDTLPCGMGLEFINISVAFREILQEYVGRLASQE